MNSEITNSLQTMRDALMKFPTTRRYRELEEAFWRRPEEIYQKVVPLWDLRGPSLIWNWELSDTDLIKCELVQDMGKFKIGRQMFKPEAYRFPGNWREMHRDKALFVIDYWLRGIPLTPPVLMPMKDETWGKLDGFHRLVIALMCKPSEIPIWFVNAGKIDRK